MWYQNWSKYMAIAAVVMCAGAAGVQAADTAAPDKGQGVVSSYEYRSVSYGNTADGKTYHRVVTTRNGVTESDVTTVDTNGGVLTWDADKAGRQVQGYMNGIQMQDGAITAAHVTASSADLGDMRGSRIDVPAGRIGGVAFDGQGTIAGVQTDDTDPTSAVSVAYLQQKLAELEAENQKLRAELEALKK